MALRGLHRRSMSSNSSSCSSRQKAFVIGLLSLISIQSTYIFWTSSHLSQNDDYVKRGLLSSLGPPISSQREEALPASLLRKNQNDELSLPPLEPNQELKLDDTSGWDPSKSVVMGMASGYGLNVYQQFVGSLRATGYSGHIILGVSTNIINENNNDVSRYLKSQNVTMKGIEMEGSVCTYNGTIDKDGKVIDMQKSGWKCPKAYPDYKITWARFLFYRDWLKECTSCTDGVVLTDVRDAYFQRDPFVTAVQSKQNHPLVLFQEHPTMINTHWLTDIPVSSCREHKVGKTPVLCGGSVMGSREGILDYIDVMVDEFDYWKTREKCRIDMPGDDQSIHNYLYYTNRFKNVITVPHRRGSIHVVGYHAARIHKNATKEAEEKGIHDVGSLVKGSGGRWQEWLDTKRYDLLDPHTGLIVNLDGSPSAQVHQVDRFGPLNYQWMKKMKEYNWPYNRSPERGVALFEAEAPPHQPSQKQASSTGDDLIPTHPCLTKKVIPHNFSMKSIRTASHQGRSYNVNLWDDGTYCKLREMMLNTEGFSLHPRTTLVHSPDDADIIVWVSTRGMWEREVPPPNNYSNVVLLDYADGCTLHQSLGQVKHLVGHFKRSFVNRIDGVFKHNCTTDQSVLPFAYSGVQAFINHKINSYKQRKYDVTNMLRNGPSITDKRRKIIVKYTKSFVQKHSLKDGTYFIGNLGSQGANSGFDNRYFEVLANSKIIVTANPAGWEGDFRLWEALLSGALVFVDRMAILDWMPHSFQHKKHLIMYDPMNQTEFENLLEYYVENEAEAEAIGLRGYDHTLAHHMAEDRVSYILNNIESKLKL